MIRLRWPSDSLVPSEAVALTHPRLVRLRGTGRWSFGGAGGAVVASLHVPGWTAAGWGPWTAGTDGCEFSVATNPPPLEAFVPARVPADAERVELACGERVWVLPARRAARRLGLDGSDAGPATAYGVALHDLSAAMETGEPPAADVMRAVFLAMASVSRALLPEVCVGLGLVSSADIGPILEAAWRLPKAQPAGASSSYAPAVSTPTT